MVNNRYQENITAEEIASHELSWFKGEIVVVDNLQTYQEVFPRLLGSDLWVLILRQNRLLKKEEKTRFHLYSYLPVTLACLFRINKIGIPDKPCKLVV